MFDVVSFNVSVSFHPSNDDNFVSGSRKKKGEAFNRNARIVRLSDPRLLDRTETNKVVVRVEAVRPSRETSPPP